MDGGVDVVYAADEFCRYLHNAGGVAAAGSQRPGRFWPEADGRDCAAGLLNAAGATAAGDPRTVERDSRRGGAWRAAVEGRTRRVAEHLSSGCLHADGDDGRSVFLFDCE